MPPFDFSHVIDSVVDTGIKTMVPTLFSHFLNRSDAAAANEYNSPAHLMSLYREAGISPAAAAQALTGSQGITANASAPAQNVGQSKSPFDIYVMKKEIQQRQELNEANIEAAKASAAEHQANADRIVASTPHDVSRAESLANQAKEQFNLTQQQTRQLQLANDRFEALTETEKIKAVYDLCYLIQQFRTAKNDADISDIRRKFAEKYQADPSGNWLNMIIQGLGSGETSVTKAIFGSIRSMLGQGYSELHDWAKDIFNSIYEPDPNGHKNSYYYHNE